MVGFVERHDPRGAANGFMHQQTNRCGAANYSSLLDGSGSLAASDSSSRSFDHLRGGSLRRQRFGANRACPADTGPPLGVRRGTALALSTEADAH